MKMLGFIQRDRIQIFIIQWSLVKGAVGRTALEIEKLDVKLEVDKIIKNWTKRDHIQMLEDIKEWFKQYSMAKNIVEK